MLALEKGERREVAAAGINVAPVTDMAVVEVEYLEIYLEAVHVLELDERADIRPFPILIVTKGVAEFCDDIAPHVAVDSWLEPRLVAAGTDCAGAAATREQARRPKNIKAEWRIAYRPLMINSGAHSTAERETVRPARTFS